MYLPLTPPPNNCDVRCAGVRGDGVRPGQPRGRGAGLGRGGGLVPGQLGATVGGLREISQCPEMLFEGSTDNQ